jgi:hypothetical protein
MERQIFEQIEEKVASLEKSLKQLLELQNLKLLEENIPKIISQFSLHLLKS